MKRSILSVNSRIRLVSFLLGQNFTTAEICSIPQHTSRSDLKQIIRWTSCNAHFVSLKLRLHSNQCIARRRELCLHGRNSLLCDKLRAPLWLTGQLQLRRASNIELQRCCALSKRHCLEEDNQQSHTHPTLLPVHCASCCANRFFPDKHTNQSGAPTCCWYLATSPASSDASTCQHNKQTKSPIEHVTLSRGTKQSFSPLPAPVTDTEQRWRLSHKANLWLIFEVYKQSGWLKPSGQLEIMLQVQWRANS